MKKIFIPISLISQIAFIFYFYLSNNLTPFKNNQFPSIQSQMDQIKSRPTCY